MGQIQQGDQRQYYESFQPQNDNGANFQLTNSALNSGVSITQQANQSKLANYQVDLSSKMLEVNTQLNTKYEKNPFAPELETERKEAFDQLKAGYEISPLVQKQWNDTTNEVYNRYKTFNTDWAIKKEQENIKTNLKSGYATLIDSMGMMGQNGSDISQVKLAFANGIDGLKKGALSAYQNPEITNDILKSSTHDAMAMYLNGMIQTDPAMALQLLNDDNSGVANDLNDANTIAKLKSSAQTQLLKQTQIQAVDRVATYINKNHEVFGKAFDGTLSTAEAQDILTDKNVDRTMRGILSDMLGYSSKADLYVDAESGDIHSEKADKAAKEAAENESNGANAAVYSTLTVGDKKWTFLTSKGKTRQANQQEQEEIRSELYLRGSQLLNNISGKTPQESIRKVAEFQSQIAQASYFGLNKGDYDKLMNSFVLPATQNVQEAAKGYNAHVNQWGHTDRYGYNQIDDYFNKFSDNLENTKGNRDLVAREKSLASVYYWSALNNYASQKGISMNDLQKMDRHETYGIYNKAAKSAIEKAKSTSPSPDLWFRSANPQYVSLIRNMLPNSNANSVITNISVAALSNPNMSDKDFNSIINREVSNEYAKMRTSNKSVVFGGNTKYDEIINKYSMMNGVDPLLVKSIIKHESGFNANARSGVGAGGLMQLMPATAKGLGCKNVYDPKQNIAAGTLYIANLVRKYDGNTALALAAYNAGSGNVKKYGNKIPPFQETQNYVKSVLRTYSSIKG